MFGSAESEQLSVTVGLQFAVECLRHSNQQEWVTLDENFRGFPLEETPDVWVCRERTSQAN